MSAVLLCSLSLLPKSIYFHFPPSLSKEIPIQPSQPSASLVFRHTEIVCSCALERRLLKSDQCLWTLISSKADTQRTLLSGSSSSLNSAAPKSRVAAGSFSHITKDLKLNSLMIMIVKTGTHGTIYLQPIISLQTAPTEALQWRRETFRDLLHRWSRAQAI